MSFLYFVPRGFGKRKDVGLSSGGLALRALRTLFRKNRTNNLTTYYTNRTAKDDRGSTFSLTPEEGVGVNDAGT